MPYKTSLCEAETLCAHLSRDDKLYAALSEDTDVLACGAKVFLHKINTNDDTCTLVKLDKILEALELTSQEFQDLCILCGTDYNSNLPKIGSHGAYKLIKEYGTIDKFPDTIDTSSLNFKRGREIFSTYPGELPKTTFCGNPKWEELYTFLFENNCSNSLQSIKKIIKPVEIIFIE